MGNRVIRPWTKVGDPVDLKDGGFGKRLIQQRFRKPDGTEQDRALIVQPDWSVVLPVTVDRQVITVVQYKHGCDNVITELPAGTANFRDEDPTSVMRRELLEETGYEAGDVFPLSFAWMATGNSPTRAHLFLARDCHLVQEQHLDPDEDIQVVMMPLWDWIKQIARGDITEWSAVVTTFRALPHLGYSLNEQGW